MVAKVRKLDEDKLFKISKFNMKGKTWDWYRRLDHYLMIGRLCRPYYIICDEVELRTKMDVVHQETRQRVQLCYDRLD